MADNQLKRFHMKAPGGFFRELDAWRRRQPDLPTRSEAVRRLVSSSAPLAPRAGRSARSVRSVSEGA